jgi:hypothetical protein
MMDSSPNNTEARGISMKTMFAFLKHINKMPVHWRLWVVALFIVNMCAVFFLAHLEAWVVLGALLFGALLQNLIFARKGFVRILGIGHFQWYPMLLWLYLRMDAIQDTPGVL